MIYHVSFDLSTEYPLSMDEVNNIAGAVVEALRGYTFYVHPVRNEVITVRADVEADQLYVQPLPEPLEYSGPCDDDEYETV